MMNEQQNFFKLLKYSNELKKNKKSLLKEDPEAFDALLKFLVIIEENLHYSEKDEYIKLAKNFLADQITADDFSYSFMAIYEGINQKLGQMKRDESLDLANFLGKTRRHELGRLLTRAYGSCDNYNPDSNSRMADEEELRNCAQILLFEMQKI